MYLEDYEIGKIYKLKSVYIDKKDIIKYAKKYDPRPFHISRKKANETRFKKLFASGFMTLNLCWLQWVNTGFDEKGMIAGVGIENLVWKNPVFEGDTLFPSVEIYDVKRSKSKPNGIVTFKLYAKNQDGNEVISCLLKALVSKNLEN